MLPDYDYPGKAELRGKIEQQFIKQIWDLPRQTGYNNYMARVYGVPPTLEGFDSVVQRHIGSDAAFSAYITTILDRERVPTIVLQSGDSTPVVPTTFVPRERFVWTCPFVPMIHPEWAAAAHLSELQDVVSKIEQSMEKAVSNGCVGFKNAAAYYRPLGIGMVGAKDAEAAFKSLVTATAAGHVAQNAPYYKEPALNAALRTYQDYLLKRIFVKAGEVDQPIIIHTAVALHPALRFEFNNPLPLYDVFQDNDIRKAATRFVLIHTGYPTITAWPRCSASFPTSLPTCPSTRSFLACWRRHTARSWRWRRQEGLVHGSDSNRIRGDGLLRLEHTARAGAGLTDYRTYYGWTQDDVNRMANNVMHATAHPCCSASRRRLRPHASLLLPTCPSDPGPRARVGDHLLLDRRPSAGDDRAAVGARADSQRVPPGDYGRIARRMESAFLAAGVPVRPITSPAGRDRGARPRLSPSQRRCHARGHRRGPGPAHRDAHGCCRPPGPHGLETTPSAALSPRDGYGVEAPVTRSARWPPGIRRALLLETGTTLRGTLLLVSSVDDEGRFDRLKWPGMTYLAERGLAGRGLPRPDMVINGEASGLRDICGAFKGRLILEIPVLGETAHAATPYGVNAIDKAIVLVDALRRIELGSHPLLGDETLNICAIRGVAGRYGDIPPACHVGVEVRVVPPRGTRPDSPGNQSHSRRAGRSRPPVSSGGHRRVQRSAA